MLKRFEAPTPGTAVVAGTARAAGEDAPAEVPRERHPNPTSPRRLVAHALVALALFGWAFAGFDAARARISFHNDESRWIATSRYFGYLFLQADLEHEVWNGGSLTLGQPPGFRYILGAGLWLQGHDLETLNQPYNFQITQEQNRREGRVPTVTILMDARTVTILFAAAAVALLYVLATQLGAPLAGVVAALLAGASPYLREHFVRAMSDATLAFFVLATLAVCLATVRRPGTGFGMRSAVPATLVLSLAMATKLTAVLSLPALGLTCLGASVAALVRGERSGWWQPLAWGGAVALGSCGVYIALYPFLWADPLGGTLAMSQYRQTVMGFQQQQFPQSAVYDPQRRLALVLDHILVDQTWANTTLNVPLDVPLAVLGLASLLAVARRQWRDARRVGPAAVVLVWLLVYLAGVTSGYRLNWSRYLAPLFLLAALLSGLGAESLFRWMGARYARRDASAPRGPAQVLERVAVRATRPADDATVRTASHRRRPRRRHGLPRHG